MCGRSLTVSDLPERGFNSWGCALKFRGHSPEKKPIVYRKAAGLPHIRRHSRRVELIEVSTPGGKAGIGAVASHIDDK